MGQEFMHWNCPNLEIRMHDALRKNEIELTLLLISYFVHNRQIRVHDPLQKVTEVTSR